MTTQKSNQQNDATFTGATLKKAVLENTEYEELFQALENDYQVFTKYLDITPDNIEEIDQFINDASDDGLAAAFYLMKYFDVSDFEELLARVDDVCVIEGTKIDAAYDFIHSCYSCNQDNEFLLRYFDYETFARDCEIEGSFCEIYFNRTCYTVTNGNSC